MPEVATVEGMDINPDEFHGAGWTTALGARWKRDPARNAAAAAAAETNASAAKKPGFNAPSSGWCRTHRRGEVKVQLQTAWQANDLGSTTAQRLNDKQRLNDIYQARAIVIQSEDEPADVDDITSEVSEAPSNASASDSNAKKCSKKKRKFSTFQSAITEICTHANPWQTRPPRKTNRSTQSYENNLHTGPRAHLFPGTPPCAAHTPPATRANRKAITVDPIPRNIHPTHNEGRRKARAKAILDKIKHNETKVLFVDAARYWNRGAYAVSVVDTHGSLVNAATVVTNFTHEAEEMAIAVALRSCTGASVIYSDSRTAIRTITAALVSSKAAAVVNKLFLNRENRPDIFGGQDEPKSKTRSTQAVLVGWIEVASPSRLQQTITATELCDRRPLLLLRCMRQLIGGTSAPQEEKLLRELFLQHLPQSMVPVLVTAGDVPVDALIEMAERVADYSQAHSFNPVTTADPALARIENRLDALVRRLDDFLPARRRSAFRLQLHSRSSTSPRSPGLQTTDAQRDVSSSTMCWYHC
ncbi:hypothetical protein HPB50_013345 [Hyalomma asiaticum]|uniref:Uncharacterized protein n=1 Tax=Hyalomma asiaticum TaxID=266040 RepID=A0ACB7S9G2_HYAAI|nr:hypothetical protein HPB50_013345 [Hyalomma asiaticum]